jgi:hypothetical protein
MSFAASKILGSVFCVTGSSLHRLASSCVPKDKNLGGGQIGAFY